MGFVLVGLLRATAFLLRLMGNIASYLGELLVNLYDVLIFPPLWIEKFVNSRAQAVEEPVRESRPQVEINTQKETT